MERGEGLRSFFAANFPGLSDSALNGMNEEVMARNDVGSLIAVMRTFPALTLDPARGVKPGIPTLLIVGTADWGSSAAPLLCVRCV